MVVSSSSIEVDTIGFPNFLTICLTILLLGIRMPIVFFVLLNIFGILLVPFKMTVKEPGKTVLKI